MKKILYVAVITLLMSSCTLLSKDDIKEMNSGNTEIEMSVKKKSIFSSSIVIDVNKMDGSALDFLACVLQTASRLKNKEFEKVEFAKNGDSRFYISGDYFKEIGNEYGNQNYLYTLSTFTEHVYNMDDSRAFLTWKSGILDVMGQQLNDFKTFVTRLLK